MAMDTPAAVVLELMTMGQQSAAHLGDLLRATAPQAGEHHELAAEILGCCGRVIAALTATAAGASKKRKLAQREDEFSPPATLPKRRARGGEAVREVRRSSTMVDGFIWRKYGQKDINGSAHPRLYYRCAYRGEGCGATRRVQRAQGEPAAYEIAYYGEHTCRGAAACQGAAAAPPPGVVDFGSANAAWGWGSAPAASSEQRSWDGEVSQSQGWSSSSSASSEVGLFEVQAHEWHDTGAQPSATPRHDDSPVLEFLDGCFDWESVLDDSFDFGGLHHVAALQY